MMLKNTVQYSAGGTIHADMVSAPAPGSMVLLTRLSRAIYQRAKDSSLGVSLKEYSALSNLRYFPNLTQQALADTLHLDPNNLVLLLNALESGNLVERRRDASDRRRHIVVLTPAGRKALERAERALESVEDDVLGGLTPEERETLHRLLLRAVDSEAPAPTKA